MSINDPIILQYNERRGRYYFTQGRETFYDFENVLIEFDELQEAINFGKETWGAGAFDVSITQPKQMSFDDRYG